MISYICDICGKLCSSFYVFKIPEYAWTETVVHPNNGHKVYEYIPKEVNLCEDCCRKITEALDKSSNL